jgi:hypothetical protein
MSDEPIRTTTFTLSRADSLAYEQAASRLSPLAVIALICWLGLCGAAALLVPADWAGSRLSLSSSLLISVAVALGYVIALLVIAVRQWWRARRRYRRPLEVTVTEWPDRLDVVGTGTLDAVPFTGIRRNLLTRTHLFLETDAEPVILPRHAFAEEGAVEDLVRRIEGVPRPMAEPEPPAPAVPPDGTPPAP